MNLRIRRRRFGQLAIVSAATAAFANLAGKTVAQQRQGIIGVRLGAATDAVSNRTGISLRDDDDIINRINDTLEIDDDDINSRINATPRIALTSLELATRREQLISNVLARSVENLDAISDRLNSLDNALSVRLGERITGLSTLSDGTFIVSSVARTRRGDVSRLIFTDPRTNRPRRALTLSGFRNRNSTLESLVATEDDQLLSIVSLNQGIVPFESATIDSRTGRVTFGDELALPDLRTGARFSNLAQSPDGTIYATTLGREGGTRLVQLDLNNKSIITGRGNIIRLPQLSLDNEPLENDLLDLAFSPSGELFALANPTDEETNSLFSVDVRSGEMTLLTKFNADKITFARS